MNGERNEHEADLAGFSAPAGADPDHGRDDLERLASTLAERVRSGRPSDVEAVAHERPELAAKLREMAPVIEALERWKVLKSAECGAGELPATLTVKQLGDCRLEHEIGRGGNAIVFAAVQGTVWRRRVAVKIFPWRQASDGDEGRARFLEEASTLSRLQHRHIVPIYSYGAENGFSYYVMRLAEGGSLDRTIARLRSPGNVLDYAAERSAGTQRLGRSDWRAMAELGFQVAEALAYAHGQGVIHGDVKPANVLLDAAGRALVTDFGPAERSVPDARNRLVGTYRYMAPERLDGVVEARGDVYSLGVTLYELVALTPAFEGDDRESLTTAILRHQVVRPRLVRPDVPADLDAIVMRSMSRDPADRYGSARELAVDLDHFLQGRPIGERPRKKAGWLAGFARRDPRKG